MKRLVRLPGAIGLAAAVAFGGSALAQSYPDGPVTIVVPYGAWWRCRPGRADIGQ